MVDDDAASGALGERAAPRPAAPASVCPRATNTSGTFSRDTGAVQLEARQERVRERRVAVVGEGRRRVDPRLAQGQRQAEHRARRRRRPGPRGRRRRRCAPSAAARPRGDPVPDVTRRLPSDGASAPVRRRRASGSSPRRSSPARASRPRSAALGLGLGPQRAVMRCALVHRLVQLERELGHVLHAHALGQRLPDAALARTRARPAWPRSAPRRRAR